MGFSSTSELVYHAVCCYRKPRDIDCVQLFREQKQILYNHGLHLIVEWDQ